MTSGTSMKENIFVRDHFISDVMTECIIMLSMNNLARGHGRAQRINIELVDVCVIRCLFIKEFLIVDNVIKRFVFNVFNRIRKWFITDT